MRDEFLHRAQERISILAGISDHPDYLVRSLLSPANRRAAEAMMDWMRQAGLEVEHTIDGSVRGILPGSDPSAAPLLIGSHFDTVIDAGAYDGSLGIISALAAVEMIQAEGLAVPFPIHLLGFSDEEGVRFQTTYIGSLGMIGDWDADRLSAEDRGGKTLRSVIETEGWTEGASRIRYMKGQTRGYIELHIEQGRVLEEMNLPAAGVSGIVGQTRLMVRLEGRADHAGTTPMNLRQDALAGAAACIVELERIAANEPPAVATVGRIEIHPGASNAIAQTASFSVDLRHPDDAKRQQLLKKVSATFQDISDERNLALDEKRVLDCNATPCNPDLSSLLLDSLEEITGSRTSMISGAGHDGVALASVMPIAMVFLRCRDGLSHHPDEFASPEDIAKGIDILASFLRHQISKPDHG